MLEIIKNIFVFIGTLAISSFCLSNIFLPFFYTLPKIRKEIKLGHLKKKIPFLSILIAPIIWSIVYFFALKYSLTHLSQFNIAIYFGCGLTVFVLLGRIGKRNEDMNEDFYRTYGKYFNEKKGKFEYKSRVNNWVKSDKY